MTALVNMVSQALCRPGLIASSSPSDLGYWIGGRYSGSLGLDWQLIGFIAIIVMIWWKSAEMKNRPMLIVAILSLISLAAFLCTGVSVAKPDAHMLCFLLNGFQLLLVASLLIHWRINTMSRF